MKTFNESNDGIIYQIEGEFEGIGKVIVDITYSGGEDENGNEILEFEYSCVQEDQNLKLSKTQIQQCNKILECGLEESYVIYLREHYKSSGIIFDIGEWKHVPYSTLYDFKA